MLAELDTLSVGEAARLLDANRNTLKDKFGELIGYGYAELRGFDFPRKVFGGVGTFARIVLGKATFQIFGRANVVPAGILTTSNDVGVEHAAEKVI